MDEQYITKYINEFQNFARKLEEKEDLILANSMAYMSSAAGTNSARKNLEDITKMTFSEYSQLPNARFFADEKEFADYQMQVLAELQRTSIAPKNQNPLDENVEKIEESIVKDVERQARIIKNLIAAMEANLQMLEDDRIYLHQDLTSATSIEDKRNFGKQYTSLMDNIKLTKQALEDIKIYRNLVEEIELDYKKTNLDYSSFANHAEQFETIRSSIKDLKRNIDKVDFSEIIVDVVFNPLTNKYEVNCKCGDVRTKSATEFTKEQITPDALQGILYKFSEKLASNSPMTVDEIRKKDIKGRLSGRDIGTYSFENAGEGIFNGLNNSVVQRPTGPTQTGQQQGQPPINPPQMGQQQGQPPINPPQMGQQQGQPPINPPQMGQQQGQPPINPPQMGQQISANDYKNIAAGAMRIKSVRRSKVLKAAVAGTLVAGAAIGLGFIAPALAPTTIGVAKFAGGLTGVYAAGYLSADVIDAARYRSAKFKLNSIARKVTKAFNKNNKKSGIKFKLCPINGSRELRFAIFKDKENVGYIDSRTTGMVVGDGYSLNQREAQSIVSLFQSYLDKEFSKYNNPDKLGKLATKYGIPRITVDNLGLLFVPFGGYKFGIEDDQYNAVDMYTDDNGYQNEGGILSHLRDRIGNLTTTPDMRDAMNDLAAATALGATGGDSANSNVDVPNDSDVYAAMGTDDYQVDPLTGQYDYNIGYNNDYSDYDNSQINATQDSYNDQNGYGQQDVFNRPSLNDMLSPDFSQNTNADGDFDPAYNGDLGYQNANSQPSSLYQQMLGNLASDDSDVYQNADVYQDVPTTDSFQVGTAQTSSSQDLDSRLPIAATILQEIGVVRPDEQQIYMLELMGLSDEELNQLQDDVTRGTVTDVATLVNALNGISNNRQATVNNGPNMSR